MFYYTFQFAVFHQPKQDTWIECDSFKTRITWLKGHQTVESKRQQLKTIEKRDNLHKKAEPARSKFVIDIQKVSDCDVITFGQPSTLSTLIMIHKLGVHDCYNETGHMRIWHEGNGEGEGRGGRMEREIRLYQSNISRYLSTSYLWTLYLSGKMLTSWPSGCRFKSCSVLSGFSLQKGEWNCLPK